MLYNIQDVLQINLPEKHKDVVTAYNTEWDIHNSAEWDKTRIPQYHIISLKHSEKHGR